VVLVQEPSLALIQPREQLLEHPRPIALRGPNERSRSIRPLIVLRPPHDQLHQHGHERTPGGGERVEKATLSFVWGHFHGLSEANPRVQSYLERLQGRAAFTKVYGPELQVMPATPG
jgi:hypothetical protein